MQFTWSNGHDAHRNTEGRLDRVICNNSWLDLCSSLNVSTLINHKSDHFPLLLDFETSPHKFSCQFKFMHMWSQHDDCKRVIQETWNINIVGCPMYILNQKLKILKHKLKIWNKTIFLEMFTTWSGMLNTNFLQFKATLTCLGSQTL